MTDDEGSRASRLLVEAAHAGADAPGRAVYGPMGTSNGEGGDEDAVTEPNAVLEHFELHRALADHDPDRLSEYLEMARNEVKSFRNPFDRAIALTFHLVLDEQMDPWSIDLVRFSSLYADRIRDTPAVDLITGGRLLAMAWNILLAQTDELLARAEPDEPEEEPRVDWEMMWDEIPGGWEEPEDADVAYTERVLDEENDPPISESVFHQGDRRVTLYELVEALEEGRRDAERRKRLSEERRKARQAVEEAEEEEVSEKVHKEDLEAEIGDVRQRLGELSVGEEVPIRAVHAGTRDDFLSVFVSSLFLSRARMIDVRQESFPYSPILITPREPLHDPDVPLVGIPTDDESFDDVADEQPADAEDTTEPEQEA